MHHKLASTHSLAYSVTLNAANLFSTYTEYAVATFDSYPGLFDFLIGLCGTQANGSKCYSSVISGLDSLETLGYCYSYFLENDRCNCSSELQDIVSEQGCCLDLYHDRIFKLSVMIKV